MISDGMVLARLKIPRSRARRSGRGRTRSVCAEWSARKTELATPWRKQLATLPNSTFDPEADDDDEDAYLSRDEVEAGVAVLEKWVTVASKPITSKRKGVAAKGNALVLVLDGDQ